MRPLTTLQFTDALIAKVWTFEYVTVWALGASLAVSINTKCPAYGIRRRMLCMNVGTRRIVAFAIGVMHAKGCPLLGNFVRQVAVVAFGAFTLQEPGFANRSLGSVVNIPASRAFGTGA